MVLVVDSRHRFQGSGLLKVSDDGVVSERIAYYTALAG